MSLTPAAAETLRRALATVVVVPVTPFRAGGTPDRDGYTALPQAEARQVTETTAGASQGRAELLAILTGWGLT
jgi:hypothetical protein